MNFGGTCLDSIIKSSFGGSKIKLAHASDLSPGVITKLTSDQGFTRTTLASICRALNDQDSRIICAAVCRDLIPEKFHDVIGRGKANSTKNKLPPLDRETESTILELAELCSRDGETREWLRQMATWMFPK
mgnify:CR=1